MAKYKVDDWVLVRGTNGKVKAHILEVRTQVCSAGIEQIHYVVRTMPATWDKVPWNVRETTTIFNEIEVEGMPV